MKEFLHVESTAPKVPFVSCNEVEMSSARCVGKCLCVALPGHSVDSGMSGQGSETPWNQEKDFTSSINWLTIDFKHFQ